MSNRRHRDVEKWQRQQLAVRFRSIRYFPDKRMLGYEISVRELRRLWQAGGPRAEQKGRIIIAAFWILEVIPVLLAVLDQILPRFEAVTVRCL